MKQKFMRFRIAMVITAMAILGVVTTSCSKDDDMFNDFEVQDQNDESSSLKSMSPPGDPTVTSNGGSMSAGYVYVTTFKRHTTIAYPNYVSAVFDFSSNQLTASVTPSSASGSFTASGMITFFNQKAYNGSMQAKGCPGFVVGSDYQVANYTASNNNKYGLDDLRCLELSDVTSLTYSSESSYTLPFNTTDHTPVSDYFYNTNDLKQSAAVNYYDNNLVIGRQWHGNCGGTYNEPIWVITDGDDYWAFCVDPYQNATSGSNKQWSTINYKILD
ncbi:hypothetical protein DMA11_14895 [Marinilabiliaceae bacterium JC017]|nr:hypothetical protein DMA11_14895 [Marinilabiliaceae bacterium JC017]